MRWFLELPPTLRWCAINPLRNSLLQNRAYESIIIKSRPFSITRTLQAKKPKVKKPPALISKAPPQPGQHVPATPQPSGPQINVTPQLESLLADHPQILLYHAPRHISFFIHSYLLGTIFIVGALFTARGLDPPDSLDEIQKIRIPWYIRTVTVGVALFFAAVGTAFWLAPSKLIRSVHLVAPPGGAAGGLPYLRFETRSSLPLIKRFRPKEVYTIDTPISTVAMDERVFGESITYYNIPMHRAPNATEELSTKPHPIYKDNAGSSGSTIMRFPQILWRDIRRMFVRDGFAYLRFPERSDFWKLDLHGAFVLDGVKPLRAAMVVKPLNRSVLLRIRRALFSKQRKPQS